MLKQSVGYNQFYYIVVTFCAIIFLKTAKTKILNRGTQNNRRLRTGNEKNNLLDNLENQEIEEERDCDENAKDSNYSLDFARTTTPITPNRLGKRQENLGEILILILVDMHGKDSPERNI